MKKVVSLDMLRKALAIGQKIEELEQELGLILGATGVALSKVGRRLGRPSGRKGRRGRPAGKKRGRPAEREPKKGDKRVKSPSGPLAPAVISILKKAGKAMPVKDIFNALVESGYKFTAKNPPRYFSARIYTLKGVKRAGVGKFKAG